MRGRGKEVGKREGGGEEERGGRKHRNNTYGMHISTCMYIAYSITLLIVTLHIPRTHTFSFFFKSIFFSPRCRCRIEAS